LQQMSVKLTVLTFTDFDKVKSEVGRIFTATSTSGCVLVRYTSGTYISLQSSSTQTNIPNLVSQLDDTQVQYALIRLLGPEMISKDIFLTWVGPKVGKIERGKKSEHLGDVKSVLCPSHVELVALTKQNFTASRLWELSDPSAGSHVLKPMDETEERTTQQQTIEADSAIRKANEQKLKQQTEEKKTES